MAKIIIETDCANSPKREYIKDFEIAFAQNDPRFILNSFADEIIWQMVGDKTVTGKVSAEKLLIEMMDDSIAELTIENVVSHGNVGSANGIMKFKDGTKFAFSDIFTFSGHKNDAKIKKLTSFVVALE